MKTICKGCGRRFEPSKNRSKRLPPQIFCKLECYRENRHRFVEKKGFVRKCDACGNKFYVARYRKDTAKYCSVKCSGASLELPHVVEARLEALRRRVPDSKLSPRMRKAKDGFFDQRVSARHRGIDWELTFKQWWKIWKDSGKWEQRGRGHGKYQMARFGDEGPYSVDNVRIITSDANLAERASMAGEDNAFSKLREKDVHTIRALAGKMPYTQIAARFGINYYHARDIIKRRCWTHI